MKPDGRQCETRVLIVDDENEIVEELVEYLTDLGFVCDAETSAIRVLDRLKKNDYSHLFLDLRMPGIDGFGLLDQLGPNLFPRLKIVVMSGHATEMDEARAYEKGISGFLLKPIDLERVVELLSSSVDVNKA